MTRRVSCRMIACGGSSIGLIRPPTNRDASSSSTKHAFLLEGNGCCEFRIALREGNRLIAPLSLKGEVALDDDGGGVFAMKISTGLF